MKPLYLFFILLCHQGLRLIASELQYHYLQIEYETPNDEELVVHIPFLQHFENDDFEIRYVTTKDDTGYHYQIDLHTRKPIELDAVKLFTIFRPEKFSTYFCNGFQSWTTSKEYFADEKIKKPAPLGRLVARYYGGYPYFPYQGRTGYLHSWTYTYLRHTHNQHITLLASVAEFTGFTIFSYQIKNKSLIIIKELNDLQLDAHVNYAILEWLEATGNEDDLFNWYARKNYENVSLAAQAKGYQIQRSQPSPVKGWTSWYHYYRNITADTILKNLRAFNQLQLPIQLFQIDDGYQQSVGEWTRANLRFPQGMKAMADSIHAKKFKAGIWLAPYIVEKKSSVYKHHKDWLLKNEKGKIVKAGYNPLWSGWFYPLNIYNKEVQQYLKNTFDTILHMQGYDMVKLDFLFAACIHPPAGKTRGEVMFDAMLLLRQWCGEKTILGCGVPLGSAFHMVDYCRVSSDVHWRWEHRMLKMLGMHERVSVWNTLTSNIGRRHLNGNMFGNDPDVYILRERKNKLTPNEKMILFEINNLFGSLVFTSDYVGEYDAKTLQLYKSKLLTHAPEHIDVTLISKDIYLITLLKSGKKLLCNLSEETYKLPANNGTKHSVKKHSMLLLN